jgi:hypothetical protein
VTLCELVFDLRFSSQIRTLAPALSLLLHEHEHALLTLVPGIHSAGTGVRGAF